MGWGEKDTQHNSHLGQDWLSGHAHFKGRHDLPQQGGAKEGKQGLICECESLWSILHRVEFEARCIEGKACPAIAAYRN